MLTTKFVRAVGVNFSTLTLGPEYVTAEGKVAAAMSTTLHPLDFVLSRATPQVMRIFLHAIIVDTNAYCAILGMESISAYKGGYNSYTKPFKYRTSSPDGTTQSCRLSAPCHTYTPLVVACAFHAGLINEYHHAPHQLAAYDMRDACLAAARHREVLAAEREHLTRRENTMCRLRRVLE